MMIIGRGVAGFGAGGEYPVCATSATEAADETERLRKKRGFLVASTTDFAVDMVCSHATMTDSANEGGFRRRWYCITYCPRLLSPEC